MKAVETAEHLADLWVALVQMMVDLMVELKEAQMVVQMAVKTVEQKVAQSVDLLVVSAQNWAVDSVVNLAD